MEIKIDEIVRQVLSEVNAASPEQEFPTEEKRSAFPESGKARTAVLTSPERYEIKEYPLPEIGGKEILVQVGGCMVSPADTAEFLKEKRIGQASVQGQEGTGRIVKLGGSGLKDARGNILKAGDRVIAARRARGAVGSCRGSQFCAGVTANGWFSSYVVLQAGSQVYQANGLDQESCLLAESVLAVNSVVERTAKLNKLDPAKKVLILGCGMEGLITLAVLKCRGVDQVIALDKNQEALQLAEEFGAKWALDFREKNGVAGVQEKIKSSFGGSLADVVFHCTPYAMGKTAAKRFVKSSGYACELGYVLGRGKVTTKSYEDTMPAGGRFYSAKDYENCLELLGTAAKMQIPMYKLITHRFSLDEINEAHWTAVREEGMGIAVFNR